MRVKVVVWDEGRIKQDQRLMWLVLESPVRSGYLVLWALTETETG